MKIHPLDTTKYQLSVCKKLNSSMKNHLRLHHAWPGKNLIPPPRTNTTSPKLHKRDLSLYLLKIITSLKWLTLSHNCNQLLNETAFRYFRAVRYFALTSLMLSLNQKRDQFSIGSHPSLKAAFHLELQFRVVECEALFTREKSYCWKIIKPQPYPNPTNLTIATFSMTWHLWRVVTSQDHFLS